MPVPTVDPLPPSPLATDSDAAFDAKAFPFFAAWNTYRTQMIALGQFTEEQADAALAAAVAGGTLPSLAGKALQYLRVNAAADGVEFSKAAWEPIQRQEVTFATNVDFAVNFSLYEKFHFEFSCSRSGAGSFGVSLSNDSGATFITTNNLARRTTYIGTTITTAQFSETNFLLYETTDPTNTPFNGNLYITKNQQNSGVSENIFIEAKSLDRDRRAYMIDGYRPLVPLPGVNLVRLSSSTALGLQFARISLYGLRLQ